MEKPEKPRWYYDKPSQKQIKVLAGQLSLTNQFTIPSTKGECSELITKMINNASLRCDIKRNLRLIQK